MVELRTKILVLAIGFLSYVFLLLSFTEREGGFFRLPAGNAGGGDPTNEPAATPVHDDQTLPPHLDGSLMADDEVLDNEPHEADETLAASEDANLEKETTESSENQVQAEDGNVTTPNVQQYIHLVTFATPSYVKFANALFHSATSKASCAFNRTMYSLDDIDEEFKEKNKKIFRVRRGAGYWLWKPYIIRKKLGEMQDGEIMMYVDSKYLFMTNLCRLMPQNADHVCFTRKAGEGLYREFIYTKRDAYTLMDVKVDFQRIQPWAGFLMLRKTEETIRFVDEWLKYSQDFRIISNNPSVLGLEVPGFRANRNDQTVLSLLLRKKKWPCKLLQHNILFNVRKNRSRL